MAHSLAKLYFPRQATRWQNLHHILDHDNSVSTKNTFYETCRSSVEPVLIEEQPCSKSHADYFQSKTCGENQDKHQKCSTKDDI